MKDAILDGNAFVQTPNGLEVNPEHAEPQTISQIGKSNNWIAFTFNASSIVDETNNYIPGVEISLSGAPSTCVLTIDEFLSVYTIIKDLSLPQMALIASSIALANRDAQPTAKPQYNNNYNRGGYQQGGYQPQQYPRQTGGYSPYTHQAPAPTQTTPNITPQSFQQPTYNTGGSFTPQQKQSNVQQMPPRSSRPSMKDVSSIEKIDVPVDDFTIEDEGLDAIFNN